MSDIEPNGADQPRGISRRTVTRAMAWAVPVVAIAAAAPAYAASQGVLTVNGNGCKLPGNSSATYKGNVYKLSARNDTDFVATVQILSVTLDGVNLGAFKVVNLDGCTVVPNPVSVPPNSSFPNLALLTADAGNSQNGHLVVTYQVTINGVTTQFVTDATSSAPPITGNGSCGTDVFSPAQKLCIRAQD